MAGNRVAVVGVGQTRHRSARKDVSMAGLVREAAHEALDDAGMTWSDIDAVVIGKAPDMFEGVAMPELYLADALGAVGKPMMRVHTAGSVGGSTAIVAAKLVAAGVHERVLTVAYEKQSESNATWGLSVPMPFAAPLVAGAGGYFAPLIRAYMYRSGAPAPHRPPRRGEGPPRRAAQPEGAPAPPRHRPEDGRGVVPAVGPAALPRRVPELRRRDGDGARQREGRRRARRARWRGSTAWRCAASRRCSPAATR